VFFKIVNSTRPYPFYSHTAYQTLSLRWFASTIQMYSRLYPWLLTWSDLEEDFINDDGANDNDDAN
jgi:hypothetical protein